VNNDLTPFTNGEFTLAVKPVGDSFHVAAPHLARALGFREAFDLLRTIPDSEKGSELVRTLGGDQRVGYVTEAGFYRALGQRQAARITDLAIRSTVERFQTWVYGEVLPSIRRGTFGSAPTARFEIPASFAEALELAARQAREIEAEKARNAELAPAAHSWTQLADASGDYSLREAAQILDRDPSIQTGQNRLAKTLKNHGWTDRNGQPYQQHVNAGRLVVRTRSYDHPVTGEPQATTQVRVTVKGLHDLHKLLGGSGPVLLGVAS